MEIERLNARIIDIIILSYAMNDILYNTTLSCIDSLIKSEDQLVIAFNIIVIESENSISPYQYPNTKTIYPSEPFGYHKYLNIGIAATSAPYICLCNNDLIFHRHWASEILKPLESYSDIHSASPICSIHHPKMGFRINNGYRLGLRIRYEVAGWCLFVKRAALNIIGHLDENFIFWGADNDYVNTFYVLNLKHLLVTSSIVDHIENKTLNMQNEKRQAQLTIQTTVYFDKKWKYRLGDGWIALD